VSNSNSRSRSSSSADRSTPTDKKDEESHLLDFQFLLEVFFSRMQPTEAIDLVLIFLPHLVLLANFRFLFARELRGTSVSAAGRAIWGLHTMRRDNMAGEDTSGR
jgi:hypothetical protein